MCDGVVNLLRHLRNLQAQYRNFYDSFGTRIAFIREKTGLTLGQLSDGAASTAKSWESGSLPRADQWEAIAARLGLSVSLVFLGSPKSKEDYDFLAKYADELPPHKSEPEIGETKQAPYGTADTLRAEARRYFDDLLSAANDDPVRLGWLLQQMREHLRRPSDWKVETLEERKRRLGLVSRSNPPGAEGQSLPTIPHGKSAQA